MLYSNKVFNLLLQFKEKINYVIPELKNHKAVVDDKMLKLDAKAKVHATNAARPLKVIVFCDSFTGAMEKYINETFGEVCYIADNHRFNRHQEIILKEKPDIVIHEVVGKYVGDLLQDKPDLQEVK